MAKELLSTKVEGETKERINNLTEKYKEQGLIVENGDLYNIVADLLERNLTIQTPRHTAGIQELDQLTSRINRLFVGMIEQNNSAMDALRIELDERYENAKLNVDSLLIDKQDLKNELTELEGKIKELTQITKEDQEKIDKLLGDLEDKSKYINLLETQNEAKENRIKQLEQFEQQNQELVLDLKQKSEEIHTSFDRITQLETAAEQQRQAQQTEIREIQFQQKEALFNKEKDLNEKYNKELSEIRNRQADMLDKHEERVTTLQDKYNALLAEKERIQALYEALKKENKPGGGK